MAKERAEARAKARARDREMAEAMAKIRAAIAKKDRVAQTRWQEAANGGGVREIRKGAGDGVG